MTTMTAEQQHFLATVRQLSPEGRAALARFLAPLADMSDEEQGRWVRRLGDMNPPTVEALNALADELQSR